MALSNQIDKSWRCDAFVNLVQRVWLFFTFLLAEVRVAAERAPPQPLKLHAQIPCQRLRHPPTVYFQKVRLLLDATRQYRVKFVTKS
jgi:hypothetical protein